MKGVLKHTTAKAIRGKTRGRKKADIDWIKFVAVSLKCPQFWGVIRLVDAYFLCSLQ